MGISRDDSVQITATSGVSTHNGLREPNDIGLSSYRAETNKASR